jgi:hypothetical protein
MQKLALVVCFLLAAVAMAWDEISVDDQVGGINCGSVLQAVYKQTNDKKHTQNCSFIQIRPNARLPNSPVSILHVNPRLTICNDTKIGQVGLPQSEINKQNRTFYWFSGVGANIWSISSAGKATSLATLGQLPTNFTIGLEYTNGTLYLIATDAIYLVAAGQVTPIQFLKFFNLEFSSVTASYKGLLYIISGSVVLISDPIKDTITKLALTNLQQISFAEYRMTTGKNATGSLIVYNIDSLYEINLTTGVGTLIAKVAPGVTGMSLVSNTVLLNDAGTLYTVDLNRKAILSKAGFNGALLIGTHQYFL